jgi:hypothetical protein
MTVMMDWEGPEQGGDAGEGSRVAWYCSGSYTKPWSIIASATLRKPAMLAPFT